MTTIVKVSWLKKVGEDLVKVFGVIAGVETVAEVPIEALLPVTIPGFAIFDKIVSLVSISETNAALVGQASKGPEKLSAVINAVGQLLDGYVSDNFPGSPEILKSEQYLQGKTSVVTQLVNSVVAFLNAIPPAQTNSTSSSTVAQASAAVHAAAALKAK
jgi:hypothetical protein